jgi:hypothetical protein
MIRTAFLAVLLGTPLAVLAGAAQPDPAEKAKIVSGVYGILPPPADVLGPNDVSEVQKTLYDSILKQARYFLSQIRPWKKDPSLLLMTDSGSSEDFVRPNCGVVQGLCFLYHFGEYDARTVGLDKLKLLNDKIIPMIRYLCATHQTGPRDSDDGKRWGRSWQSPLWATILCRGCWWIWRDLPPDLQLSIRKLAAWEADAVASRNPPHQITYDTKAEENAWNSGIFSIALLLMPEDSRAAGWQKAFQRWTLSSFPTVSDCRSDVIVDGKPLRDQILGANVHDDYTLENHNRIHPGYMTTFSLSMGCWLDYAMTGRMPPESIFFNVRPLYENIKWLSLPSGGNIFPQGQDWELQRHPGGVYLHILMASRLGDSDAWSMMKPCLNALKLMQARNPCGSVFREDEFFFPSAQSDLLAGCARAWLELAYREPIVDQSVNRTGVRLFDEGRFVLNRTATAVHTVSWGSYLMAQINPLTLDRLTDPHYDSGVGHVLLEGEKFPERVELKKLAVHSAADSFDVTWQVQYGHSIRSFQTYQSNADGSFHITEKLIAVDDCATAEIATGLIAILNNENWINERGRRTITADVTRHEMVADKGESFQDQTVQKIDIDGAIQVATAGKPLSVWYRGAKEPTRARHVDELYLNAILGQKTWKKEQVISEYDLTIQCTTASNHKSSKK